VLPATPTQPAAAGQVLSWAFGPFSTYRLRRSTVPRGCRPATFRLQGLVALLTVYSLRSRAGLVSCRRRSWDSPFGGFPFQKVPGAFPPGRTHVPLNPPVNPASEDAGPARRASVSGLRPFRKCLAAIRGFSPQTAGASLGFRPSRVSRRPPWLTLPPTSSPAFCSTRGEPAGPPTPRSFNQPSPRPAQRRAEARRQPKQPS
jgi:hypothetical protein